MCNPEKESADRSALSVLLREDSRHAVIIAELPKSLSPCLPRITEMGRGFVQSLEIRSMDPSGVGCISFQSVSTFQRKSKAGSLTLVDVSFPAGALRIIGSLSPSCPFAHLFSGG